MRYVALLRAINVGGHFVAMKDLREQFELLKLAEVRTFIQSGNVFFTAKESDAGKLEGKIEKALEKLLGYEVPVLLRSIDELETILSESPFVRMKATAHTRLCVVFTRKEIPRDLDLPLLSPNGDTEIIGRNGREAYVVWHLMKGRPPSSQRFLTENLGDGTTTRFYHTMLKMLEAARSGKSA